MQSHFCEWLFFLYRYSWRLFKTPPLFFVQLRGLEARVTSQSSAWQNHATTRLVLCLSPLSEAPQLFFVQLRGLEARVTSQSSAWQNHATTRLVLCLSPLSEAPQLFFVQLRSLAPRALQLLLQKQKALP
ncbi:hypothetical protein SAMN05877753_102186 [Bacillus oleivorans]|uniref:Uncharacterized protein n=1 Tax=Bacillus oleivorans TaxID=1448271 RepID=A0A285CK66_9BACI|nr:hypothetical protein SAMN05877753_102186 [Bacillus oleivorans]